MRYITTSWDDGHPLDFRLAELLEKYNLTGTFYIPKTNRENEVMPEAKIQELSYRFEVGGHTMGHTRISTTSPRLFEEEIGGCYEWLMELLGKKPESFCFPGGVYNYEAVRFAMATGFKVVRTTELLNLEYKEVVNVLPTTIQVYNHSTFTYAKHLVKRRKFGSLALFLKIGAGKSLEKIIERYVEQLLKSGGCFHLWGHSWELENCALWPQLEIIFKTLTNISEVTYVTNAELQVKN